MSADITAATIDKILDIAKAEVHEVTDALGRFARYSTKPIHEVKAAAPALVPTVKINTLAGFADLVRAHLENLATFDGYLVHIEDFRTITLKARTSDDYGRREVLIHAQPVDFDSFRFGQWQDQETFAISVASLFAETEDKGYVLKMASSLTNEATSNTEDDGFTQRATVKAGLAMKQQVTIKPRVSLAPFRTFPEVQQPASDFVFRARSGGEGAPSLMLVEADGGAWKVSAIKTIKASLEAFELGIPIIA